MKQAILVDSLMTMDAKSPDQSVAQQLATTRHDLFKPLIVLLLLKSPTAPSVIVVGKPSMT